jgi:hypothetical protein
LVAGQFRDSNHFVLHVHHLFVPFEPANVVSTVYFDGPIIQSDINMILNDFKVQDGTFHRQLHINSTRDEYPPILLVFKNLNDLEIKQITNSHNLLILINFTNLNHVNNPSIFLEQVL